MPGLKRLAFVGSLLPLVVTGLFAARGLYELAPIALAFLGDWLASIGLALVGAVAAYRLLRRHTLDLTPLWLLAIYVFWPDVNLRWALILLLGSLALMLFQAWLAGRAERRIMFFLSLAIVVLYLLTLGDHVGQNDTFEWQVVMPQLGIGHPTGYPLLITLGKLFSLLPFGSMAWRLNLLSATTGTVAVLLALRFMRLIGVHPLAATLAALSLGGSSIFWSQAVEVIAYPLDAALVTLILVLLVTLLNQGTANRLQPSTIYLLFLVLGLTITHHLNSVIVIPPLILTFIFIRPKLPLKSWLIAAGCLLLGLTPWLYIPLRWPALHNGAAIAASDWLRWIFAQRFGGALNLMGWLDGTRWSIIGRITLDQFGVIGAALAAIGLAILFKRSWRVALITLGTFAGYIFFGLAYNVANVEVFFIPAFVMMAIWIGVTFSAAADWAQSTAPGTARRTDLASHFVWAAAAVLPLSLIAANYVSNDYHGRRAEVEDWGRYVLSLPIPQKAALLLDIEKMPPLYYLQVNEHLRPDLDLVLLGDEAEYRQQLDQRIAAGQPVYLARFLPNLPYHLRSLGPLVEVSRQPLSSPPAIERSFDVAFGNSIRLLGINEEPGDPYRVTLFWQATSAERQNYHVRLRLLDAAGTAWWEDAGAQPVGGYYSTGAWSQGEIVPDFHEIQVAPFVPSGDYTLELGWFMPFRPDGLTLADGTNWLKVGTLRLGPRLPTPLAQDTRLLYGQALMIQSLDKMGVVPPASEVTVRVNSLGTLTGNTVTVSLVDAGNNRVTLSDQAVQTGQSKLAFRAPDQSGLFDVRLSLNQPARCRWLAPLTSDCSLGSLEVADDAIRTAINFDNQVLLTNSRIDQTTLMPGGTIKIDLTWRGLKPWPADYTAFVHLLGPDNKVHGQADQWPVQGTLATSRWTGGQSVVDPYIVTLPYDAPSGQYHIEVGWYLLATLRRLPVLDTAGRATDDRVIIGEFLVP